MTISPRKNEERKRTSPLLSSEGENGQTTMVIPYLSAPTTTVTTTTASSSVTTMSTTVLTTCTPSTSTGETTKGFCEGKTSILSRLGNKTKGFEG